MLKEIKANNPSDHIKISLNPTGHPNSSFDSSHNTSSFPASNPSGFLTNPSSFQPSNFFLVFKNKNLILNLLILILICISSLILVLISLSTLPSLKLPTSLKVVNDQILDLKLYAHHDLFQFFHISLVLSIIFIWKQAFSIPGTLLLNVLIGAIYGTWSSTLITCFLTAIGSTCAYYLAKLSRPILKHFIPNSLDFIQNNLEKFKSSNLIHNHYDIPKLSSYLLIARLLPIIPYAALNLASGILEIPLIPFFWTLLIGSLPYNFLTTQVGDLLATTSQSVLNNNLNESPDLSKLWTNSFILKLVLISIVGILPILIKHQLISWAEKLINLKSFQTNHTLTTHSWLSSSQRKIDSLDDNFSTKIQIDDLTTSINQPNDLFSIRNNSILSTDQQTSRHLTTYRRNDSLKIKTHRKIASIVSTNSLDLS
ncbi:hypothetical protein O181_034494 [Austropuccinia psidii MF-1]|uniref:VTT domain-containing protein n=1 Tax=Austropuccinia psidii MF-1 TaxID=1389203 RepID=A0A9Q3D0W9_9BASI|nr:hypothetical protein [Austropuccinia psidii MF-1]